MIDARAARKAARITADFSGTASSGKRLLKCWQSKVRDGESWFCLLQALCFYTYKAYHVGQTNMIFSFVQNSLPSIKQVNL
jgi:hypothetical protein